MSSVTSSLHAGASRGGRGASPGVFTYWRSGDGSVVVDATSLKDAKDPTGERQPKAGGGCSSTSKKSKKAASIAGSSAVPDGNKVGTVLVIDSHGNGYVQLHVIALL